MQASRLPRCSRDGCTTITANPDTTKLRRHLKTEPREQTIMFVSCHMSYCGSFIAVVDVRVTEIPGDIPAALSRVDFRMTISLRFARAVLLVGCVVSLGCGEKEKPAPKVFKIGDGNATPAPQPTNVAKAGPPPAGAPAIGGSPPPLAAAEPSKRGRKKGSANLELADEGELGPGKQRFAALPHSSPGGVAFAINGDNADASVDRFAFVPGPANVDSTMFAYTKPTGPAGIAGIGLVKDDSQTEYEIPVGFTLIESTGESRSGLPWRIRCDEDGAVMALVPEGVFIQGSNSGVPQAAPEHGVLLDAYYIDVREVTYSRYENFREASSDKTRVQRPSRAANDPHEPVLGVTWAEAHAFALWAGKDLPTEAQWEKAARGPDGFRYPWGNGPAIWNRLRLPGQIDLVASFRGDESPYGVFDMAGNAREWCNDWYTEKYYTQLMAESGSTARNPTGPRNSGGTNMRVVKGGDPNWFAWARTGIVQVEHPHDVGFRCVLKLKRGGSESAPKEKAKGAK